MELVALLLQLPDLLAVFVFVKQTMGELVLCVVSGMKRLLHTLQLACVCLCAFSHVERRGDQNTPFTIRVSLFGEVRAVGVAPAVLGHRN